MVVGLHRARGDEIVDLMECPVLHPALFALIAPLRGLLSGLAAVRHEASVVVNWLDSGADFLLRTDGPLIAADRAKLDRIRTGARSAAGFMGRRDRRDRDRV